MCTKNTALGDVSQDKYSTRLRLVLYLSLETPPSAVFSIQTRSGALSNMYSTEATIFWTRSTHTYPLSLYVQHASIGLYCSLQRDPPKSIILDGYDEMSNTIDHLMPIYITLYYVYLWVLVLSCDIASLQ